MDEVQNLILNVKGQQDAERLRTAIEAEEKSLRELNDVIRQNGSLTAAQAQQQQQAATAMLAHQKELVNVEKALAATSGGTRNLANVMTQGSYAIQDFTSTTGDLGQKLNSVSNNVQMIAMQLPGWGKALAVVVPTLIAVYRNWEAISSLWQERNPFPEATSSIVRLETELKTASKDLEELHKKTSLSNEQLLEFNTLTERAAKLQNDLNEKKKAQQFIDAATGGPIDEETAERRNLVKKALAGQEFHNGMSFDKQLESVITGSAMSEGRPLTDPKDVEAIKDSLKKGLESGSEESIRRLLEMIDQDKTNVQAFRGDFPSKLAAALPESVAAERKGAKSAAEYDKAQEEMTALRNESATNYQANEERLERRRRELNEQGAEGQRLGTEQREKDVKEDAAEAKRIRDDYLRRHERDQADLTRGLGAQFLDEATGRQADILGMRGRNRQRAQGRFDAQLQRAARQQLQIAGVPAARIDELAPQVSDLVTAHTDQRRTAANAMAASLGIPAVTDNGPALREIEARYKVALDRSQQQNAQLMATMERLVDMQNQTQLGGQQLQALVNRIQQGAQSSGNSFLPPGM